MIVGRAIQAGIFAVCTLAAGCSSVVYKDAATQYVVAAKNLVKFFSETDSAFKSTSNLEKTAIIETDANCPIAQDRLFVRNQSPPGFAPYIDSPSFRRYVAAVNPSDRGKLVASCAALKASEAARRVNACYSTLESGCLVALEHVVKVAPGDKASVAAFAVAMSSIEYDSSVSSSQLLGQTIAVVTGYMDALSKVVDAQTDDLDAQAKKLNAKITDLQTNYKTYTGNDVSADTAARLQALGSRVTALGALLNDVNSMAASAQQIAALKALLIANKDQVSKAIAALSPQADAEVLMNATLMDHATMEIRNAMQRDFASARTPYERGKVWEGLRTKYPYSVGKTSELTANVDAIFLALQKSHDNLVSLLENPSSEQKAQLRSADFVSFRNLVEDALSTAASFK